MPGCLCHFHSAFESQVLYTSATELTVMLNDSLVDAHEKVKDYITDDELAQIVAQTFEEADTDKDGKLSFAEFRQVIEHTDIEERLSISFQ